MCMKADKSWHSSENTSQVPFEIRVLEREKKEKRGNVTVHLK